MTIPSRDVAVGMALTPREIDALAAYARDGGMAEAAHHLGITIQTMKNHLAAAYAKLDVQGGINAFRAMGWLRVPGDLDETKATVHAQSVIARAEAVVAELRDLLRASGSDAGSSVRHQANKPTDIGSPVAGSADVAVTPAPS